MGEEGRIPNSLLRNEANGTFVDVTRQSGLFTRHPSNSAAFADYDFDGGGEIEYPEYIRYTLRDAIARSMGKVMDLFKKFDTGQILFFLAKSFAECFANSKFTTIGSRPVAFNVYCYVYSHAA